LQLSLDWDQLFRGVDFHRLFDAFAQSRRLSRNPKRDQRDKGGAVKSSNTPTNIRCQIDRSSSMPSLLSNLVSLLSIDEIIEDSPGDYPANLD
jgi:hypothetical protein